jgi:hypothetical protein
VTHYEVTNRDGTMVEPMICDDDDDLDHLIETAANESEAATPKPKKLPPKVNPKLGEAKATNASKNSALKLYHR